MNSKLVLAVCLLLHACAPQCLPNYQYSAASCMPCQYNCFTCYDDTACLQCMPEYYLDENSTCHSCSYGCSVCTAPSCSSCGAICTTCNLGLYIDANSLCHSCPVGVAMCTIATIEQCKPTYFLLGTICAGCFTNCLTCSDFISCTSCALSYYLSSDGTACLSCTSNCVICSSASVCTSCVEGYSIKGGACYPSDCKMYPFCVDCGPSGCMACQKGKYLFGSCKQGGSILCQSAVGPHYTNCDTSNYGCTAYSAVQFDPSTNTQLPVCSPLSATTSNEYLYGATPLLACPNSCLLPSQQILTFTPRQSYYQISFHFSIQLFSVSSHNITLSILTSNTSYTLNATPQLNYFQDTQCGCPYAEQYFHGSIVVSGGASATNVTLTDLNGLFNVVQFVFSTSICTVNYCGACSTGTDCLQCIPPYLLQLNTCLLECDAGYYLFNSTCLLTCPTSTFTISSSYECTICLYPCSTCSSAVTCLSCADGTYLDGTVCVNVCSSASLFPNITSRTCTACPNPCSTCKLDQSNQVYCASCNVGLLYNSSVCVFQCPEGYYANFDNGVSQCGPCAMECTSCFLSSSVCSACVETYLLINSTCTLTSTCPPGLFPNLAHNTCQPCQYPCATCSLFTVCTSCLRGLLFNSTCLPECPPFYYTSPSGVTCTPCLSPCAQCSDISLCLTCLAPYYLSGSLCLSLCPNISYALGRVCAPCLPPCLLCSSASVCLSCSTGYLDGSQCVLKCNQTAYPSEGFTCTQCVSPCQQCSSAANCLQCILPYVLYDAACLTVSQCAQLNMYVLSNTQNGLQISATCSTCSSPCASCVNSAIACLSCIPNYYYMEALMQCVSTCVSGYFANGTKCSPCSNVCYECVGVPGNCTKCSSGQYILNATCLYTCPSGMFGNTDGNTCDLCVAPCGQCLNAYLCLSCITGFLYDKSCRNSCPEGSLALSNSCPACTNNCFTCSGSLSNCTSCTNPYYLWNWGCVEVCQSGTYGDLATSNCKQCVLPCGECNAPTYCLTCAPTYSFLNNTCLSTCPGGYYTDASSQCVSCNRTICATCSFSPNNCSSCALDYYMLSGACVTTCPKGYFPNPSSSTCDFCVYPCAVCLNSTYCTTCVASYSVFMNRCFSTCPTGFYPNQSTCLPCSSLCAICSSISVCLSCVSGLFVEGVTCVSTCSTGFYGGLQQITNYAVCLPCLSNCVSCSSSDACLQCASGMNLFNSICLLGCPAFYYSLSGVCLNCSSACASCSSSTVCLVCVASYLSNGMCVQTCPSSYFLKEGSLCVACVAPCENCTSLYTCASCVTGYIYFFGSCVTSCPSDAWYFPANNTCTNSCPYNKDASQMRCYIGSCGITKVTQGGYCLSQCPSGYYVNNRFECILCDSTCTSLFRADLQVIYSQQLSLSVYFNQQSTIPAISDISISFTDISGNPLNLTLQSYTLGPYSLLFNYGYYDLSVTNIVVTLPYLLSADSSQGLIVNRLSQQIVCYKDYSLFPAPSVLEVVSLGMVLVLGVMVVVNIINKSSHFTQLLDYMQIVACTLYFTIQYPPVLEVFLAKLNPILLVFPGLIQSVPYQFSTSKFIFYHTDSALLRSQLLPSMLFLLGLTVFTVIITINTCKPLSCVKPVAFLRYRFINDFFALLLTPLLLFAFQLPHATSGQLIIGISIGGLGIAYVGWISYKILHVKKLQQIEGLHGEDGGTDSKLGLMYTPFGYLRRIILSLTVGITPSYPISTLTLLFIFTALIIILVLFYRPFAHQYTNHLTIFMEISLIVYILTLIILALSFFSAENSHYIAVFAVLLLVLTMLTFLLWLIYITLLDIRKAGCCPHDKIAPMHSQEQPPPKQTAEEEESASQLQIKHQDNASKQSDEFKHWSNDSEEAEEGREQHKGKGLPEFLLKKVFNQEAKA